MKIMKTIRKTILLILVLGMMGVAPQKATAQVSVSFQLFYDNLSPYGNWIDNPNYGYVWVPDVPYGFSPYRTNGYWVYTEVGCTWVSNYSWGWAPFHYGRWLFDPYYGWTWVPDTYWGPAWVTWRYYDGYYGWAAIGPGISLSLAYSSGYDVPYNQWVFVKERDFGRKNLSNYYVGSSNNAIIINKSKVVNNIRTDKATRAQYNAGPNREDVQKRSKASFPQVNLKARNKPGQRMSGSELQLYKPRVEKGDNGNKKPTPAKVMGQNDVKSIAERRSAAPPKGEMKREKAPQINQPPRQQENRDRKIIPQQQKREEIQMPRSEPRAKEQKIQRNANEAPRPQSEIRMQRNEQPRQLQRNVPRVNTEILQQPMGNNEQRFMRENREHGNHK